MQQSRSVLREMSGQNIQMKIFPPTPPRHLINYRTQYYSTSSASLSLTGESVLQEVSERRVAVRHVAAVPAFCSSCHYFRESGQRLVDGLIW